MRTLLIFTLAVTWLWADLLIPKTLQATFVQQIHATENNETLTYRGSLRAKLPDEAIWHYQTPIAKEVCIKRGLAYVIEPELEQVTLYSIEHAVPILEILNHAEPLSKNRYLARYNAREYALHIDDKGHIRSIGYTDELDNRAEILFETVTYDEAMQPIECIIPKTYDLLDARN